MQIKPLSKYFNKPTRSSELAGGFDLFMPEKGVIVPTYHMKPIPVPKKIGLGFAAAVPKNHVALILPRSGKGANFGVALNNTVGVIDADYRGEWMASVVTRKPISWKRYDRLFQFIIVPVVTNELEIVDELSATERADGGFGSSDTIEFINFNE